MMTFIVIVVLAILAGAFLMRNRIATLTGLSADTITRVCIMLFFCLIVFTSRSCDSVTTGGAGSDLPISIGALVLILIVLLTSAGWKLHTQPDNIVLPFCLVFMSAIVLIALLGKLDSLFSWAVGILIVTAVGFWGTLKTTGRVKTFLGFASGALAVFWLFLLYLTFFSGTKLEFIDILFPDSMSKMIFTVFLAFFIFATLINSKLWRLVSICLLLSVLGSSQPNTGQTVFGEIIGRYPKQLTPPPVSQETKDTAENVWKAVLREVNNAVKPAPATTQTPASTSAPATSAPAQVTKSIAPQEIRELYIKDLSIPATLSGGRWKVDPADTEYQKIGERKMSSNGILDIGGIEEFVIFSLPGSQPGTYRQGKITLIKIS